MGWGKPRGRLEAAAPLVSDRQHVQEAGRGDPEVLKQNVNALVQRQVGDLHQSCVIHSVPPIRTPVPVLRGRQP